VIKTTIFLIAMIIPIITDAPALIEQTPLPSALIITVPWQWGFIGFNLIVLSQLLGFKAPSVAEQSSPISWPASTTMIPELSCRCISIKSNQLVGP
jgi:hypothetical protein